MFKRPRIIPTLLLENEYLVKTVKFSNPDYIGDPVNAVRIFNDLEVDELCILDISAGRQNRGPNFTLISDIASEAFMPLAYGGGIMGLEQVKNIFKIGYEKVILNTALYKNPGLVKEAAAYSGSQSIVASIDVARTFWGRYRCYNRTGILKNRVIDPVEQVIEAACHGAGEIFLNSVALDGTMKGYDLPLISRVSQAVDIPVIACGGAGSVKDFKKALEAGADAVAAGSMFVYFGKQKAVLINSPTEDEYISNGIYTAR